MSQVVRDGTRVIAVGDVLAEMISAAKKNRGDVLVLEADQTGRWVSAGAKDFYDPNDPSVAAHGLDALDDALRHGLLRHEGGTHYRLTGKGWDFAHQV